jgi:hypothetical protein
MAFLQIGSFSKLWYDRRRSGPCGHYQTLVRTTQPARDGYRGRRMKSMLLCGRDAPGAADRI